MGIFRRSDDDNIEPIQHDIGQALAEAGLTHRPVPSMVERPVVRQVQDYRPAPIDTIAAWFRCLSYGDMMEVAKQLSNDAPGQTTMFSEPELIAAWLHRWAVAREHADDHQ